VPLARIPRHLAGAAVSFADAQEPRKRCSIAIPWEGHDKAESPCAIGTFPVCIDLPAQQSAQAGIDMFNLEQAKKALEDIWQTTPSSEALTWTTPVRFDATLVTRLINQHQDLNTHFATLVGHLDKDPEAAEAVHDCANRLHELRRDEALWLYPVITRGVARDPIARRLFSLKRLVMLGLARNVLRCFDELELAVRRGNEIAVAADRAAKALAEYRWRSESQVYPLYSLMEQPNVAGIRAELRAA
jgi:hypothetical protein